MLPLKLPLTSVKQNQNLLEEGGRTRAALVVQESRSLAFANFSLFSQNDCCLLLCFFLTCRQTGGMPYIYILHLHYVFYLIIFFSWISFEQMVSYSLYLVILQRILELFISCILV